jgi:hypothetical protein
MRITKNALLSLMALSAISPLLCKPAFAQSVTLAWDANSESDLAGYKIYYGTSSRNYSTVVDVKKVTSYTVTGLGPGTWYFALTAYNTSGAESSFSNEVSKTFAGSTCDVNLDGSVNGLDDQRLINIILKTATCPGNCDLNGDGRVDGLDLALLDLVIVGSRVCQ